MWEGNQLQIMIKLIFGNGKLLFSASRQISKPAIRVYLANTDSDKADIAENE
jgi:hypothetical protein